LAPAPALSSAARVDLAIAISMHACFDRSRISSWPRALLRTTALSCPTARCWTATA